MPWYRFHITSVSGKDQTFRWIEEDLGEDDEAEIAYQLDSWIETQAVFMRGERAFTSGYEKVRTLPPDVRQKMIDDTKRDVERNSILLNHLRQDAIKNPPPDDTEDTNWISTIHYEATHKTLAAEEADAIAARAWEVVDGAQSTLARYTEGVEKRSAQQGAALARDRAKKRREHR